jgi:hypothetical protein
MQTKAHTALGNAHTKVRNITCEILKVNHFRVWTNNCVDRENEEIGGTGGSNGGRRIIK